MTILKHSYLIEKSHNMTQVELLYEESTNQS